MPEELKIFFRYFLLVLGFFALIKVTFLNKKLDEKTKRKRIGFKIKKKGSEMRRRKESRKIKKEKGRFYRWMKSFLLLALAFFFLGISVVAGLFIYFSKDLPNPDKVNKRSVIESTKIYDRTGKHVLYEVHGEEKRTVIPMNEIPEAVKYATISLEDQGFYYHYGVDMRGIIRAVVKDITKGSMVEGGSTITQQFIKNSLLTSEKRISRKIKELILAIEIEQKFNKDEILRMYLNEIPYGSNAYGIEAAAQTFFGVHAKELTLAQSALLASLPQAPSYYSPSGSHVDKLLSRWKHALNEMARLGYITIDQAKAAKSEDIIGQIKAVKTSIRAPHFVFYVKSKLAEEFTEEEIEQGGFNVYTTLDVDLQDIAERSVAEGVEKYGEYYNFTNSALVAVNPKNGQVLAMVGSKDYFDEEIDGNVNVAIRSRQPGSSFKPYVFAQAFRKGYQPKTILFDVRTEFVSVNGESYNPQNYDGRFHGPVEMGKSLAMSLNIPAVKTLYLAGVENSIDLAESMGIKSLNTSGDYGLSLVLGGGEVKLLEHVGAFGVFANQGIKHNQQVILKIEDSKGDIIKDFGESKGFRVLEKNVALQICDILSNDKLRIPVFGPDSYLKIPGRHVAAKTGTTNEYRDGWLVGAAPSLAAGVWSGNNDNTPMKQGAAGTYVAGPIWNDFMREALKNYNDEEFEKPEEIEVDKPIVAGTLEVVDKIKVCEYKKDKYCLENKHCPEDEVEKKKFFVAHNILHYVNKKNPLGEIPRNPQKDLQYKSWEEAVLEWGKEHADGKGRKIIPDRECKKKDF